MCQQSLYKDGYEFQNQSTKQTYFSPFLLNKREIGTIRDIIELCINNQTSCKFVHIIFGKKCVRNLEAN